MLHHIVLKIRQPQAESQRMTREQRSAVIYFSSEWCHSENTRRDMHASLRTSSSSLVSLAAFQSKWDLVIPKESTTRCSRAPLPLHTENLSMAWLVIRVISSETGKATELLYISPFCCCHYMISTSRRTLRMLAWKTRAINVGTLRVLKMD